MRLVTVVLLFLALYVQGTNQAVESSTRLVARNEAFAKVALYDIYMARHEAIFNDPKIPSEVKKKIRDSWTLNTVALMEVKRNGQPEYSFAANIHTVNLKKRQGQDEWDIVNTDFGLNEKDIKVVRQLQQQEFLFRPELNVAVKNVVHGAPLTAVEVEDRAHNQDTVRMKHAEIKLKKYYRELQNTNVNDDLSPPEEVAIGASKPACKGCHEELGAIQNNGVNGFKPPPTIRKNWWASTEDIGNLKSSSVDNEGAMDYGESHKECTNYSFKFDKITRKVKNRGRKNKKPTSGSNCDGATSGNSKFSGNKFIPRARTFRTHSRYHASGRTFRQHA